MQQFLDYEITETPYLNPNVFAIDKKAEIKRGIKRNKTREAISQEITAALHVKGLECIGNLSGATITMVSNHVEKEITQNKQVKGKLNKIKKRILNI